MAGRVRLLGRLALCLAVAAGATLVQPSPVYAESNGGVKIMPLGDSITDGFNVAGSYRTALWQKLVAGKYTVDFVGSLSNGPKALGDHDHEGHSGWTISQVDAKVVGWLKTYQPRTILMHIGTNDMYGSASTAAAGLGTLIDHITTQAPNAELFVAQIIPMPRNAQTVQAFNSQIPGLVKTRANAGKHVHVVDMYSKLTTADLADGVHPNATGYSKMADAWYTALLSVPASLAKPTVPTPQPVRS